MRSSCKHHPLDACMHRVASTRTNIKSNTLKLQFYCRVRWFYKQSCTQCCTCYTVKYWPASERKLFNEYIEHFGGNVEHAAKNQHHRTDCSSIYFVFREEAVKNKLSLENRIVEFIWNAQHTHTHTIAEALGSEHMPANCNTTILFYAYVLGVYIVQLWM